MKKLIIIAIILFIAAAAFAVWGVRAVTATPEMGTPEVILEIDQGGVEIWPASGGTWRRAKDGEKLSAGDRVRTLDKSAASIIFYDSSIMRLDANTEITISALDVNQENFLEQNIGIEVVAGRVWSRILNLLDLDSKYEVKTSSVVATVRGTAFAVAVDEDGETQIDVTESLVDVTMYGISSTTREIIKDKPRRLKLEAGSLIKFDKAADVFQTEPSMIPDELMKSDWFLKNLTDDNDFAERVWGLRRDKLRKYIKALPDSPVFVLQRLAERTGLALTNNPDKRAALEKLFMSRRLAEVAELAHQDKVGLASQELINFENLIKNDGERNRAKLGMILPNLLYFNQGFWADVLPVDRSYRLKQKMEELGLSRDIIPEKVLYWKLITIEGRLSEAQRLMQFNEKETISNVLEVAKLGLENLETEVGAIPDSERKQILTDKIEYDLKKFGILQEEVKLLESVAPDLESNLQLELREDNLASDELTPVAEPETTIPPVVVQPPATEEPASTKVLSSLTVSALPNPIYTEGATDLLASASYVDGTSEDVAAVATWTMYGAIGTITNGTFIAGSTAGSARLEASFTSGGVTKTASFTMTVKTPPPAEVTLSRIELTASSYSIYNYETANLYVRAYYSDGSDKDVTGLVSCVNSNPSVGYISGSVFHANPSSGSAVITASYTEAGVTKSDAKTIEVSYNLR
ncbi:MAG: DUF5667 domain-containing protein [Patescibacteria group bacterium]|nr:DUF5667 domain-containing protein [Patescibacteria group bacterium]